MLLLQFVQQYGSEKPILYRQGLAVFVELRLMPDKSWPPLQLSGQTVSVRPAQVLCLVKEGNRPQLKKLATAVTYVLNLLFETARRHERPELPVGLYVNRPIGDNRGIDPLDVSVGVRAQRPNTNLASVRAFSVIADLDVVAAVTRSIAGLEPNVNIVAP